MLKKIKHTSELPDWFQIKKYSITAKLTAIGWLEQLWFRIILDSIIRSSKNDINNNPENKEVDLQIYEIIELIQKNPIIDLEAEEIAYHDFFYRFRNYMHRKLPLTFGVRSITTAEFLFLEKSIDNFSLENARSALEEVYSEIDHPWCSVLDGHLHTFIKDEESIHERSIAHINWDLPNTVLVEHFKEYLIKNRPQEINDKRRNRGIDFHSWHRFGILPYIDLKTWELVTGNSIPNRVIADALYPHGEYGEETIRKTTATITESIINDEEIINLLLAEAYHEQSKEKIQTIL